MFLIKRCSLSTIKSYHRTPSPDDSMSNKKPNETGCFRRDNGIFFDKYLFPNVGYLKKFYFNCIFKPVIQSIDGKFKFHRK